MSDNPNERRSHNRKLAETCAKAGLYVFPSSGKVPLTLAWERADTAIGTDGVEEIRATARQKAADKNTTFDEDTPIGATTDPDTVKRYWRKYPDAVPSISLGPSKLLVLDCDIDETRNGPELVTAWAAAQGIDLSNCPMTRSRSGGLHIYFSGPGLRSHVGKLMKSMYCQVKAAGNQVVAPGAWREDGKRYSSVAGHPPLLSTFAADDLPPVPAPVLVLQTEREQADSKTDDQSLLDVIAAVRDKPIPETSELEILFDLDELAAKDEEFRNLRADPSSNTSDNRFTYLKCLQREFGDKLQPIDYFAFLQDAEGMGDFVGDAHQKQGEWNYRNFARDLINSRTSWSVSDGNAFGKVDDTEPEDGYLPDHYVQAKAKKALRNAPFGFEDQVQSADLIARLSVEPLIDGLLDQGAISVLYGASNVGKSFVAAHLAYHVAAGLPWSGRETTRGAVVFFALEGRTAFRRRVVALSRALDKNADGPLATFATVDTPALDLKSPAGDAARTIATVRDVEGRGEPVRLIVIDTLAAATPGMDESGAADMTAFVEELKRIRASCPQAHILVVHHAGKDLARGARGHSSLRAAVDTELEISRGVITVSKQRDHEFSAPIGFRLEPVNLGDDERGRPMRTAVVELCNTRAARSATDGAAFGDVSTEELSDDKQVIVEAVRAALQASEGVAVRAAAVVAEARRIAPHLAGSRDATLSKILQRLASDVNAPVEQVGRRYRLRSFGA